MSRRMWILTVVIGLVMVVFLILQHPVFGRSLSKKRKQRILQSPNYRDGAFRNQVPTPQFTNPEEHPLSALQQMIQESYPDRTPTQPITAVKTDLKALPKHEDWLVWFGHSSYLFCLGGKTFLVDPLLKMELPVSLVMKAFKGTEIYRPEDLPDIDYLIVTHEHWDHLDYATLRGIRAKVKHTICTLGVGEYLEYWKYPVTQTTEMDWYEEYQEGPLRITCLPTRHFSNRLTSSNQTLWASFMVELGGKKVYIGGDGGYDHRFKEVRERFGTVDLALMENGQYNGRWAHIHLMPDELEQAILDLQAKRVMTVHHGKFALAMHPWVEPDMVAHDIADRTHINLLDQPIGTVIAI